VQVIFDAENMLRAIHIIFILSLASCVNSSKEQLPRWQRSDFVGQTFSLDHPTRIEDITFSRQAHLAPVTFGTRDGEYTEICGPLMYWRLKGGKLEVYDYDKTIYESFTLVSKDDRTVTVHNLKGKRITYQIKEK
jgi:hypothetical protein